MHYGTCAIGVPPYGGTCVDASQSTFETATGIVEDFPTTAGRLGCGVASAYITNRCGAMLCALDGIVSLKWERRLDDISEAEVEIALGGDSRSTCCECLAEVEPYCHELWIRRDGMDVWAGPIIDIVYGKESITIQAEDRIHWATVRVPPIDIDFAIVADDLTDIGLFIFDTLFAEDIAEGYSCEHDSIYSAPSTIIGKRFFPAFSSSAYEMLQKLGETGLDYTTIAGTISLTGDLSRASRLALLTDELILGDVQVKKSGRTQGNRWYVNFDGDLGIPAVSDDLLSPTYCYSRIERLRTGDDILDQTEAELAADSYAAATGIAPRTIEIPPGSRLSPDAPWTVDEMVCGVRVDVSVTKLCVSVTSSFRLTRVEFSYDEGQEECLITLSPLNDVAG